MTGGVSRGRTLLSRKVEFHPHEGSGGDLARTVEFQG